MLEQYFFCIAFLMFGLIMVIFWQSIIGDSFDPLSGEQIACLRDLANKYPSINYMVKKWLAKKKTLRLHHLDKAKVEADCIERRTQGQRKQREIAAEMSLLANVAPDFSSIIKFSKNPNDRK